MDDFEFDGGDSFLNLTSRREGEPTPQALDEEGFYQVLPQAGISGASFAGLAPLVHGRRQPVRPEPVAPPLSPIQPEAVTQPPSPGRPEAAVYPSSPVRPEAVAPSSPVGPETAVYTPSPIRPEAVAPPSPIQPEAVAPPLPPARPEAAAPPSPVQPEPAPPHPSPVRPEPAVYPPSSIRPEAAAPSSPVQPEPVAPSLVPARPESAPPPSSVRPEAVPPPPSSVGPGPAVYPPSPVPQQPPPDSLAPIGEFAQDPQDAPFVVAPGIVVQPPPAESWPPAGPAFTPAVAPAGGRRSVADYRRVSPARPLEATVAPPQAPAGVESASPEGAGGEDGGERFAFDSAQPGVAEALDARPSTLAEAQIESIPAPPQAAPPPYGAASKGVVDDSAAVEELDDYWSGPVNVPPPGAVAPADGFGRAGEFSPVAFVPLQPGANWAGGQPAVELVADQTASAAGEIPIPGTVDWPVSAAEPPADLAAPVPAEAAAYAAEITADEEEDMGWEGPPEIGPDGRGPWLDGPDAPWGTAPGQSGRRALVAGGWGAGVGLLVALVRVFLLS
jgi:hypothetical protein